MPDEPLIVDRASSAVRLSDGQVAEWAADKRVFISSVMEELSDERRSVANAVRDLGAEPVWFEEFGGRDQDPEQAYLSEVDSSHIYIGILGTRYGRPDPATGFSATHAEYLRAVERGLRVSVWVLNVNDMEGHQRTFLEEVRSYFTTETVDGAGRLAARVSDRLRSIAAEDVTPWCKVGNVALRASTIRDDGTTITVETDVRDGDVAHALQRLRPDVLGGGQRPLRVVFTDTATTARVESVHNTVTAGSSQRFTVTLTRDRRPDSRTFQEVTYNGYSPDDLTEIGLRRALLAEPSPIEHGQSFTDVGDPIGPLRQVGVSEESLRPILRIMLTEALVGSGRASRIVQLLVGPPTAGGRRRLLIEWEPPPRYGRTSDRRQVEGTINL